MRSDVISCEAGASNECNKLATQVVIRGQTDVKRGDMGRERRVGQRVSGSTGLGSRVTRSTGKRRRVSEFRVTRLLIPSRDILKHFYFTRLT